MPPKTNSKSRKNLTRFAYESTGFNGWRVSVTRHGEVFTRYFSDRQYGGMKKSQDAARKCLEAFLAQLDKIELVETKRRNVRGKSGNPVGVSESAVTSASSGEIRTFWVASWPENGRRRILKFPVAKHGTRKARQMAIEARREAEERLGLNVSRRFRRDDVLKLRDCLASL